MGRRKKKTIVCITCAKTDVFFSRTTFCLDRPIDPVSYDRLELRCVGLRVVCERDAELPIASVLDIVLHVIVCNRILNCPWQVCWTSSCTSFCVVTAPALPWRRERAHVEQATVYVSSDIFASMPPTEAFCEQPVPVSMRLFPCMQTDKDAL